MNLRISRHPIHVHITETTIVNRLAEAELETRVPKDVQVESFFDQKHANEDSSFKLHFAWVEASTDLYPADVRNFLLDNGWCCADATIGAALVRDFWYVLPHILNKGGKFALLGQVSMNGNDTCYATVYQGKGYARVLGTRSVYNKFPSTLPVLVYKMG